MAGETNKWISTLRGRFLVFDGPDGSGKSTQIQRFAEYAQAAGVQPCVVREPGGTPIGEQIRKVLLDPTNDAMDLRCEMLLYMASRAQLINQVVGPALERGELVIADRFISSTLAYQGTAGGLATEDILAAGRIAVGKHWPDLVVIFDVDEQTAAERLMGGDKRHRYLEVGQPSLFSDRMEVKGMDYQRKVRNGYLEQARNDPDRYLVIDAAGDEDTVFDRLLKGLRGAL